MNKYFKALILVVTFVTQCHFAAAETAVKGSDSNGNVVVAYVTSWSKEIPDPFYMTHINYAFGHVNDSFDGVRIDNESRFRKIIDLKKENPSLKVLLSIGGWGSGRFSEMAADKEKRKKFAESCRKIVDDYGIDGIDIDWEYPGSGAAGISSSPEDPDNFALLMRDLRKKLGKKHLLTLASSAEGVGCKFDKFIKNVDFVNVMTYDMELPPLHHSPLYNSENTGRMSAEKAVNIHLEKGVPVSKLVLGMPFYGRGIDPYNNFVDFGNISVKPGCRECWDSVAQAPYIADADGKLVIGFDNARSLKLKCDFAKDKGLKGVMYWDYSGDNESDELRKTVATEMLGKATQQTNQ